MTDLLTPDEAAARLGISTRTLRDLTDSGQIAVINVGAGLKRMKRRFSPADLEAFIEKRRRVMEDASCRSTGAGTGTARRRRHTAMTSNVVEIDFSAKPPVPQNAKR